ncbi:condensation domain-containing protein [Nocardia callitridis]|uniref:Condensation domain-containing protein n=1 Tax=Nocardia callitridis TaxID=648753 RepID=A0ABP9KNP3_9NOCA
MEFTELADYPLPAGTVTEWVPVAHSAAWQFDDRPLSYNHQDHCERTDPTTPDTENSWIGAVFEVPLRFDEQALRTTLTRWTARHESFRTTAGAAVDDHGDLVITRYTCPAEDITIESTTIGPIHSKMRVHQHICDFFGTNLTPMHWPHCLVATVSDTDLTRADEAFLLIFGADHSVLDAYSMLLAVSEIQRIYRSVTLGDAPELPTVGSYLDYAVVDRGLGEQLHLDHPVVSTWRHYLNRCGGGFPLFPLSVTPRNPRPEARDHTDLHQSGLSSWVLSAEETDVLERRCRDLGHSIHTAALATLAATNAILTDEAEPLRFAMPMHTRHDAAHVHAMGWYVGIVPIEIDLSADEDLHDRLTHTATAVRAAKSLARYPYPRVARLLANASTPKFVVSYLDVRHVPDAAEWQGWNVRPLRSGERSDDEVYFWIARSPAGMAISARFPSNEVAAANVHRFINTFSAQLSSAATTEPTPSRSSSVLESR